MRLRHFHEVDAARHADAVLTITPPAPPCTAMVAGVTAHVQSLGSTIRRLDVHAAAATFAAEPITDDAFDAVAGLHVLLVSS